MRPRPCPPAASSFTIRARSTGTAPRTKRRSSRSWASARARRSASTSRASRCSRRLVGAVRRLVLLERVLAALDRRFLVARPRRGCARAAGSTALLLEAVFAQRAAELLAALQALGRRNLLVRHPAFFAGHDRAAFYRPIHGTTAVLAHAGTRVAAGGVAALGKREGGEEGKYEDQ